LARFLDWQLRFIFDNWKNRYIDGLDSFSVIRRLEQINDPYHFERKINDPDSFWNLEKISKGLSSPTKFIDSRWSDRWVWWRVLFSQRKYLIIDGRWLGINRIWWEVSCIWTKSLIIDGWWLNVSRISVMFKFFQEKLLMVDEGKRRVMFHRMSASMFHDMSANLTPQNDISCLVSIHMSFHVNIVSTSNKIWMTTDG